MSLFSAECTLWFPNVFGDVWGYPATRECIRLQCLLEHSHCTCGVVDEQGGCASSEHVTADCGEFLNSAIVLEVEGHSYFQHIKTCECIRRVLSEFGENEGIRPPSALTFIKTDPLNKAECIRPSECFRRIIDRIRRTIRKTQYENIQFAECIRRKIRYKSNQLSCKRWIPSDRV